MTPRQDKIALRAHLRALRRDISPDEREALSARICAHLLQWLRARSDGEYRTIALYLATPHEANLDALIAPLQVLGKRIVAPYAEGFAVVRASSTWGAHGWREADGDAVDVEECDLILIPGLAFGRDGSRLGQGGGWYDRALRNSYAILLGVAFELQIVDALPTQKHDVWMQWIATEEGVRARTPPSTWSGLNLINS